MVWQAITTGHEEEKPLARGESRNAIKIGDIGEFALIDRLQRFLQAPSGSQVVKSIGDDCAVLQPASESELILTTDSQEEGIHYRLDWSTPEDIGWRCLAINVSDCGDGRMATRCGGRAFITR
jgi:hypothetical protein